MRLASLWVIWGFFSLGVLGWGLKLVLEYIGSFKDAPVWVQAAGSILAIIAAIGVSQWAVIKQGRDELKEDMRCAMSNHLLRNLWLSCEVVNRFAVKKGTLI